MTGWYKATAADCYQRNGIIRLPSEAYRFVDPTGWSDVVQQAHETPHGLKAYGRLLVRGFVVNPQAIAFVAKLLRSQRHETIPATLDHLWPQAVFKHHPILKQSSPGLPEKDNPANLSFACPRDNNERHDTLLVETLNGRQAVREQDTTAHRRHRFGTPEQFLWHLVYMCSRKTMQPTQSKPLDQVSPYDRAYTRLCFLESLMRSALAGQTTLVTMTDGRKVLTPLLLATLYYQCGFRVTQQNFAPRAFPKDTSKVVARFVSDCLEDVCNPAFLQHPWFSPAFKDWLETFRRHLPSSLSAVATGLLEALQQKQAALSGKTVLQFEVLFDPREDLRIRLLRESTRQRLIDGMPGGHRFLRASKHGSSQN